MLIVAVSFFASCSDDDDYNTQEVTVGFESATIETSEGAGMMDIPVMINGKNRNGDINFHINVEGVGNNPAEMDENFYITGYDFNVPADSLLDRVNIQIVFVNDRIPTEARQFKIDIVGLHGAQEGIMSTLVTINDNDGLEYTYESLYGKYEVDMAFQGTPVLAYGHMGGATVESDPAYNKRLKLKMNPVFPATGELKMVCPINYAYDPATNEGVLGFVMNQKVANLTTPDGTEELEFILLHNADGHEKEPLEVPFTMTKTTLKDAQGNNILDKNGNVIEFNVPNTMKFNITDNKAILFQTMPGNYQGGFGVIQFNTLKFVE